MRRSIPLLLISLMLFQTASMLVMDSAEATSGRGGSNDDFQLFRITVGNSTDSANTWVQSDQSTIDYIVVGDEIEINVEIKRLGNSQIGRTATGTIDIVHPIGFVIESYSWTTDEMVAGQIKTGSYTWMPMIAHSILNTTTNDLTGGLIIRASVFYSGDDRNENDVLEQTVPVAVMKDSFDGPTTPVASPHSFLDVIQRGGDATAGGSWQTDTGGPVGTDHWRHSTPGAEYPSGAHDRLVNIFFLTANNVVLLDNLIQVALKLTKSSLCRKIVLFWRIHLQSILCSNMGSNGWWRHSSLRIMARFWKLQQQDGISGLELLQRRSKSSNWSMDKCLLGSSSRLGSNPRSCKHGPLHGR